MGVLKVYKSREEHFHIKEEQTGTFKCWKRPQAASNMQSSFRRRNLKDAKRRLAQVCGERDEKLAKCRRFFLEVINPRASEDEIIGSKDYQSILMRSQKEIGPMEVEVRKLEADSASNKKAPKTNQTFSLGLQQPQPRETKSEDSSDDEMSDGEESRDDYKSDDEESINEVEQTGWTERAPKSKFFIAPQGFRSKIEPRGGHHGNPQEETLGEYPGSPEFIEYKGRTLHRNTCYQYESEIGQVIVGIVGFYSSTEAVGVLVIPFSETFLGMEEKGVDYKASYQPLSHVQVQQYLGPLPLDNFKEACRDVVHIPDLVYKPQTEGDWLHLAYFYNDKRERCGKRSGGFRMIDMFSGAGIMIQGLHSVGFETICAVEKDANAAKAFKLNHPGATVERIDMNIWVASSNSREMGRIDHIHASPPCQGYSGANRTGGQHDKENNDLSLTFVKEVGKHRPVTATFENVPGMWKKKNQHYLKNILAGLMQLDYQVRFCELDSSKYGDAQARPRLFIFAAQRFAYLPCLPQRTHGEGTSLHRVTVKDALQGMSTIADRAGPQGRYDKFPDDYPRLEADSPASTIRCSRPPLHYEWNRPITLEEMKALFSLPPEYKLVGSETKQRKQLGNSVPVELAAAVGRAVAEVLKYTYTGEKES